MMNVKTLTRISYSRIVLFMFIAGLISMSSLVKAQSTNDLLNLMVSNNTITAEQADSVRAEAAIKQQETDANKKSFFITAARGMKLAGYTQIRYQNMQETGKIDGADIRRARVELRGDVTPYWAYQFQVDFAGTSGKLLDAVADFKPYDFLNFSIGQTKIPLTYENQISDNKMEAIDRSQVVEALVARGKDINGNHNGRDLGILIGGNFLKIKDRNRIEYRLGLFNGEGINLPDSNDAKSFSGRIVTHLIKGLDVGGSFYSGWDRFVVNKGEPDINQSRGRYGFELNYTHKALYFRGEYLQGNDGSINRQGWYLQSGYFVIPEKVQLLAKYDVYDPNTAKADNISTRYVIGATYQFNNWAKLSANYSFCEEESTNIANDFLTVQFQVGF